jgi:hypothetical protein
LLDFKSADIGGCADYAVESGAALISRRLVGPR